MNCLEFRQRVLADPYDPELREHAENCEKCRGFRQEILDMDSELEKALKVPVPEGLAARVFLNQSLESQPKPTPWVRYGMAASFVAALVLAGTLLSTGPDSELVDPIATSPVGTMAPKAQPEMVKDEAMSEKNVMTKIMDHAQPAPGIDPYAAHAAHQPHDFYGSEHQPISNERLAQMMSEFHLTASLDHVVYAAICPFQGENAVHLVIKDGVDQYTVMLLPDHSPGKMYTVDDTLWRGYVSPHPAGALAVLAEAHDSHAVERIREIADRVQSSIYFSANL